METSDDDRRLAEIEARWCRRNNTGRCWDEFAAASADDIGFLLARVRAAEAGRDRLAGAVADLRKRMQGSIDTCCEDRAGISFCESYGCGTLKRYIEFIDAATADAAGAGRERR